jgi:histidyl-tRNA synthetase
MLTRVEPRLPRGMRDLLPPDMLRRRFVVDLVERVFEEFGFEPLQTPALELEETLLGKYGPEAEKLIFFAQHPQGRERLALRYDLSVPLARVVAMHQDLPRPFKRYQIAPVWRAERPQRGRYREFVQCDADIVGTESMMADAEIVNVIHEVLTRLGFEGFVIKMNNRKILNAIGQYAGVPAELLGGLYRSIDKLASIGPDGVKEELGRNQIPAPAIDRMLPILEIRGASTDVLTRLRPLLASYAEGIAGIDELQEILTYLDAVSVPRERCQVEFSMVRGLEYYTGAIFETVVEEPKIGSLTGGGRYDNLIGLFSGRTQPATGTTIGIERIIDVMEELNMFPPAIGTTVVQVLMTVFDEGHVAPSLRMARELRRAGLHTEVFFERKSLSNQIRYALKKEIPVLAVLGPEESRAGQVTVRNLRLKQEKAVPQTEAAEVIKQWLATQA